MPAQAPPSTRMTMLAEVIMRPLGARLLNFLQRVVAVLVQVANLLGVDLHHAQQQLP